MKKTNWNNVNKSAKNIKKNVKTINIASKLLDGELPLYAMKDVRYVTKIDENGNKNRELVSSVVDIRYCKPSTLRRLIKLLEDVYYVVNTETQKNFILSKKIELETELSYRKE